MPTIGVAIAIPEPWGGELQAYREGLGDETARQIPTHVTLLPPTEVADGALADVECWLDSVAERSTPFTMHLRGTGTFRPVSPVVFIAVAQGISRCERLADAIRSGPLSVDLTFPYHPHITVAHELAPALLDRSYAELAGFEARFTVEQFHLYAHDDLSGWRPTRAFALRGQEPE